MSEIQNSNPTILDEWQLPTRAVEQKQAGNEDIAALRHFSVLPETVSDPEVGDSLSDEEIEPIDAQEIFDLVANVRDPEHPVSLAQLSVVALDRIAVRDSGNADEPAEVHVEITPTITHCSLATLIGLGLRVRLERSLPPRFRIKITVTPGTHQSEHQVNKQLNDKERVAAACENEQLLKVIADMLKYT